MNIWTCKIGEADDTLPDGADWPMRQAVATAYEALTGKPARFIFSGWGGQLTPAEREVVDCTCHSWPHLPTCSIKESHES